MKNMLLLILAFLGFVLRTEAMSIVVDGVPLGSIYSAEEADELEWKAATELRKYLRAVSGAELAVSRTETPQTMIYVGKSALPEDWREVLRPDEIRMIEKGGKLYLYGENPAATLYCVYEFIERQLGVRFLDPCNDIEDIPPQNTLEIPDGLRYAYAPRFTTRSLYDDPRFMYKVRSNGCSPDGTLSILVGFCHTFEQLIPPSQYYDAHPEWFAMRDGVRLKNDAQLCLANDEMRAELIKNALAKLAAQLEVYPGTRYISISQNDNNLYCTCEACAAVDAAAGSPSGSLIHFVNLVAEEIEKKYPDILVETLAYQYSSVPPKNLRTRHNVMIRLCTDQCVFNRPFSAPENRNFFTHLTQWSQIATHLGVWHYVGNFGCAYIPYANLYPLREQLETLAAHQVTYLYLQGAYNEFFAMRNYIYRHLLWDQSYDVRALAKEFAERYYGEAAPEILAYLDLLEAEAARPGAVIRTLGTGSTEGWLSLDGLLKGRTMMERALAKSAGNAEVHRRVRQVAFALDVATLLRGEYAGFNRDRDRYPPLDLDAVLDSVASAWEELQIPGFTACRVDALRKRIAQRTFGAKPDFCREVPDSDYLEFTAEDLTEKTIDDPKAAGGKALKYDVAGGWYFQMDLPVCSAVENYKWSVYVSLYCEAEYANGALPAFAFGTCGATDSEVTGSYGQYVGGDYRWLKIGTFNLNAPNKLWAANQPGTTTYIDRIVLVREPEP